MSQPEKAGILELTAHVSGTESEVESAIAKQIGRGRDPREQRRVPEAHVQYVGPKPHPWADLSRGGQDDERVRSAEMIGRGE